MALKLTVTPSTQYIEDSINIKITGGSIPSNLQLSVTAWKYWGDVAGNYGQSAYEQERNISSNFNITCPDSREQSPSGVNYGLPYVYQEDFTLNTAKLNVQFDLVQGSTVLTSVWKAMYIKPQPPTFDTIPIYEDTNGEALNITNNNQIIANNLSNILISNVQGTVYKDGTLKSIEISEKTIKPYVSNSYYSFLPTESNTNLELSIKLIDSRGWKSEKKILADASKFRYSLKPNIPNILNCEIERDGISETVNLEASGYYLEGYQVNQNPIDCVYKWKESNASSYTGESDWLTLVKTPTTAWADFNNIISEYENPQYSTDDNIQYYTGTQWNNGISDLFNAAISYNNKYTQAYLEADYDSINDRYRVISGGYNGSWKTFWLDTIKAIYETMYGENGYGGNYEWKVEELAIQGDISTGFSIDKSFYVACYITYVDIVGSSIKEIYIDTAIPAVDVYKDKIAFHGLFDTNVDADIQLNGGVSINGVPVFKENIIWQDNGPSRGIFLQQGQYANLSKKISETKRGIVMVWSYITNGVSEDWGWNMFYVPKSMVSLSGGSGLCQVMSTHRFEWVGMKYFYLGDSIITGHSSNAETGTKSGITYNNNKFALRYVIEV